MYETKSIECGEKDSDSSDSMITIRRRRLFQRKACIISVMAAFILGVALGVFVPIFGLGSALSNLTLNMSMIDLTSSNSDNDSNNILPSSLYHRSADMPNIHFPTIYDMQKIDKRNKKNAYAVSFLSEEKLPAEDIFRNAFYLEENKNTDTMTVKKLDTVHGSINEFAVKRTADGFYRKGPERRLSKPSAVEQILSSSNVGSVMKYESVEFVKHNDDEHRSTTESDDSDSMGVLEMDIFWGEFVEKALPNGFSKHQTSDWNEYVKKGVITKLEIGCGRMQNRMVIFEDGTRACARYRQNTDQIQGELFSFYLGQLLNLTNLAPSAASIIDINSNIWQFASEDILNAQWKSLKPVVLTKWLSDLEPAGIPMPFQPLERHLNKYDVRNITLGLNVPKPGENGLLNRLGVGKPTDPQPIPPPTTTLKKSILNRLIELAQWSDLIVFDYLIANLDRVVNNLYNYQWNADIMAAPAHNLARQRESQLLVFLDNESGLLHGYRLLKKYEAYHGLLLDNLCVFRRPTIHALQQIRDEGVGPKLQQLFESTTLLSVRDVLPPLPDKSIKILNDRIDRVLGQVQKCRELFSSR